MTTGDLNTSLLRADSWTDENMIEPENEKKPRFFKEFCSFLMLYKVSIIISTLLVAAVVAWGFVAGNVEPQQRVYVETHAHVINTWAFRGAACPTQGDTVHSLTPNTTSCTSAGCAEYTLTCLTGVLTWKSYFTIALTVVTLIAMIGNMPPDLAMLSATVTLLLFGVITQEEAWGGFSDPGVLAVGVLFIVANALQATGAVDAVFKVVLGQPSSPFVALLRLQLPVAVVSAFMNNTPVVAMLIPVIELWSHKLRMPASYFLMPLSFASMLGGMCTLLGTSTNLVVQGLVLKNDPDDKFGTFGIAPVGVPVAILGILYMAIFAPLLLPDTRTADDAHGSSSGGGGEAGPHPSKGYPISFLISAGSTLDGESVANAVNATKGEASIVRVTRNGATAYPADTANSSTNSSASVQLSLPGSGNDEEKGSGEGGFVILPGDVVHFLASPAGVVLLRRTTGLTLTTDRAVDMGRRRHRRRLVEVILDVASPLVGSVISSPRVYEYDAAVIAIRPRSLLPSGVASASSSSLSTPSPSSSSPSSGTAGTRHARSVTWSTTSAISMGNLAAEASDSDLDTHVLPVSGNTPAGVTGSSSGNGSGNSSGSGSRGISRGGFQGGQEDPMWRHRLRVGDALLLETYPRFLTTHAHSPHFALVREVEGSAPPRRGTAMDKFRMGFGVVVLATMVSLSALQLRPLLTLAVTAAILLVGVQCITVDQAFRCVKGRVLLAIVAAFGIGNAMRKTFVAAFIANNLVHFCLPYGPIAILMAVSLVTSSVGCVVSNNATVILMYPICEHAAKLVPGLALKQFLVVLMVSASASFVTPISYQTNLMVLGPGGYAFSDFFKFGLGLQLMCNVASVFFTFYIIPGTPA